MAVTIMEKRAGRGVRYLHGMCNRVRARKVGGSKMADEQIGNVAERLASQGLSLSYVFC